MVHLWEQSLVVNLEWNWGCYWVHLWELNWVAHSDWSSVCHWACLWEWSLGSCWGQNWDNHLVVQLA